MPSTKGDGRGERGRAGEAFAQDLLEREGYSIVDVNVRFGSTSGLIGELDIVAWDGATLCFVEVKTLRGGQAAAPAEAVTPAKQRRIARLALAYASRHGLLSGNEETSLRFDVVAVVLAPGGSYEVRRAELMRGAFLAPDGMDDMGD